MAQPMCNDVWPERPTSDSPGRSPGGSGHTPEISSPERAGYSRPQGFALGYQITPLWGWSTPRLVVCRAALSLVEVVAATMIVGLMAVAALNSLGAATKSASSIGNRAVALGLADELMAEILGKPYCEPGQTSTPIARESGETARADFDDVDDYHGWDQTLTGDRTDWRLQVQVIHVQPLNPFMSTTGNADEGAKQIRVTVKYKNQSNPLAEQIAIRTDSE